MAKEEKYMERINAQVVEIDEKHFIRIENAGEEVKIPLSDDKPKELKSAFNQLIIWIKKAELEIEMDEVAPDLFSQVAKEYITQLNQELQEVREEMNDLGLINESK